MVPEPRVAAASADFVHEQQNPWLASRWLPLLSEAQPQVGLALRGPSSQDLIGKLAPVLMMAWCPISSIH